jgi:hypothetical protein
LTAGSVFHVVATLKEIPLAECVLMMQTDRRTSAIEINTAGWRNGAAGARKEQL